LCYCKQRWHGCSDDIMMSQLRCVSCAVHTLRVSLWLACGEESLSPEQPKLAVTQKTVEITKCRLLSVIAWTHKRKTVLHIQKLEGWHGEILGSESNTALPLESGKIPHMNSVDKDFSSSIFWEQLTYDTISVTSEQPEIRFLLVESGDSPYFSHPQSCAITNANHTLFNSEAFIKPKFSLKTQQTARRVLKMDRSRPSSGTPLTHYHKLNISYKFYVTIFVFQLRFWYAQSWTQHGT